MRVTCYSDGREVLTPPRELQERITRAGGRALDGRANFRVVWGWSRLTWIGGKWGDNGPIEYRLEPKYLPADRWILEALYDATHYGSPESWARQTRTIIEGKIVEQMGPYPSRGDYEHVVTLHAPLSPTVCDHLVDLVRFNRGLTKQERRTAIFAEEEQKERDWHSFADSVLSDHPSFHLRPYVTVNGQKEAS